MKKEDQRRPPLSKHGIRKRKSETYTNLLFIKYNTQNCPSTEWGL